MNRAHDPYRECSETDHIRLFGHMDFLPELSTGCPTEVRIGFHHMRCLTVVHKHFQPAGRICCSARSPTEYCSRRIAMFDQHFRGKWSGCRRKERAYCHRVLKQVPFECEGRKLCTQQGREVR